MRADAGPEGQKLQGRHRRVGHMTGSVPPPRLLPGHDPHRGRGAGWKPHIWGSRQGDRLVKPGNRLVLGQAHRRSVPSHRDQGKPGRKQSASVLCRVLALVGMQCKGLFRQSAGAGRRERPSVEAALAADTVSARWPVSGGHGGPRWRVWWAWALGPLSAGIPHPAG